MSGASFEREPPIDPIEAALADLKVASDAEAAEGPLVRLAEAVRYTRDSRRAVARERAIAVLNGKVSAPAKLVDAFFATEQHASKRERARPIAFLDPEPWPDAVDGAALLEAIANALSRHVALPVKRHLPLRDKATPTVTRVSHGGGGGGPRGKSRESGCLPTSLAVGGAQAGGGVGAGRRPSHGQGAKWMIWTITPSSPRRARGRAAGSSCP
jgi:hypothetical protein